MSLAAGTPSSHREGQTFDGASRLVRYVNFVKLPHTVFALPFALVGVTLASAVSPVTPRLLAWVVLAFTTARFTAMGFNRIVDRRFDARNPRTAMRELPSGAMTVQEAWALVIGAAALFEVAAWRINPLCLALSPAALALVCFYSFTKRFTRWSHLVLGLGMGIAPAGGYLATTGHWSDPWWLLPSLSLAVMTWGGGFDVMYALQDVAFDREHGLFSLPAMVGERTAIVVARALHALTIVLLAAAGIGAGGGWLFGAGVAAVLALLVYEHSLVSADDLSRLDAAFFTMNGVISIVFFLFVLADRFMR